MTVATKIMMGSGGVPEEWALEQSLIFNKASSSKLERTPSSGGNRRTFTISTWFKIGEAAVTDYTYYLYGAHVNGQNNDNSWFSLFIYNGRIGIGAWTVNWIRTNRLLRDHSAWYHIVVAVDTTLSTAAHRVRLYVNGVEQTSDFEQENNPSQNLELAVNRVSYPQTVGSVSYSYAKYWDGYMAEYHLIDGTQLTPSSFGETTSATGQWTPKEYEGSYGTNGFYLKFASGAIGTDSSGEGNNYTASNLANADVVTDTPTNNFCTLNSVDGGATFSEGNLKATTAASDGRRILATIGVESGKWYWEFKPLVNVTNGIALGVTLTSDVTSGNLGASAAPAWGWYSQNTNDGYSVISGTYSQIGPYMNADDVIGAALDLDNSTITFYKNGSAANLAITIPSSGLFIPVFGDGSNSAGSTFEVNFGQKTFAHTPPSGFLALSTANLPDPAIPLPSAHFNTALYNGNGSSKTVTTVGFQPGLTWIKNRTAADWHSLTDSNRGVQKTLFSNYGNDGDNTSSGPTSGLEQTFSDGLTAFNSDGFTVGSKNEFNTNNENFVSWNWKAGSNASNTDGTYTTTVSANQTAGFSIVTYTGQGYPGGSQGTYTFGHGLSEAPTFILIKKRAGGSGAAAGNDKGGSWVTSASAIDPNWTGNFYLNAANAYYNANGSATNYFWAADPTSSLISLYYDWFANGSSATYVAYCFHDVPGYSKIGIYTGNGSADGPFVNTGFKPAWLMYKIASTTVTNGGDWGIRDLKRDPANVSNTALYANLNAAEGTTSITFDILSNGFKARSTNSDSNQSGQTFLYIAFAESPFKTSNAH